MRYLTARLPRFALPELAFNHQVRTFNMSSTIYSSNSNPPSTEEESKDQPTHTTSSTEDNKPKSPLALPSIPSDSGDAPTQIDMSQGGTTVQLDHLGPMVVNTDGTMSRISNWDKMAEIERKATLRIIGKRNQARLEKLRKERGEGETGEEGK